MAKLLRLLYRVAGFYFLVVVAIAGWNYWRAPSEAPASPPIERVSHVRVGDQVSPSVPIVGCKAVDVARSILDMAAARDLDAYKRAFIEQGMRGECNMLTVEQVYFVVERPFTGHLIRVRQKGETVELWTERGVMKKR